MTKMTATEYRSQLPTWLLSSSDDLPCDIHLVRPPGETTQARPSGTTVHEEAHPIVPNSR